MKIEKIDINKMDGIDIWLISLANKINELVDKSNQYSEKQSIAIEIDGTEIFKSVN